VHCGEAVVSADDLIGHDVNVAARVADAATGGEVLTTLELRDAVGPLRDVAFGPSRSLRLKGLDEPVDVCAVSRR
jgi:adenylate cyclase